MFKSKSEATDTRIKSKKCKTKRMTFLFDHQRENKEKKAHEQLLWLSYPLS